MSRSRRKTPVVGNSTARSDKDTKVLAHRQRRVAERACLSQKAEMPDDLQFGNPCLSNKDGKQYLHTAGLRQRLMRK